MQKFSATLDRIGINPFVFVPTRQLNKVFKEAGRILGPIPIRGTVNGKPYRQTLVKFKGSWRLYINTTMLPHSPKRIGERIKLTISFDPIDRTIKPHPSLARAMREHPAAKLAFDRLTPSRRLEIVRYISFLKTESSVERNVAKVINFLLGNERFAGRDKP